MRTPAYLPVSQKSTIWKINIYLCSLWHHSQPSQYLTMSQKSSIWKIDMYLCSLWHHVRTPESARVCVRAWARQYFRPEPCHASYDMLHWTNLVNYCRKHVSAHLLLCHYLFLIFMIRRQVSMIGTTNGSDSLWESYIRHHEIHSAWRVWYGSMRHCIE